MSWPRSRDGWSLGYEPVRTHHPKGEDEESSLAGCSGPRLGATLRASLAWVANMIGMKRGRTEGEQLLVLWTWLLEGYIPVAHMVADLDELEAFASNELGDAPSGRMPHAGMQFEARVAA